MSTTTLDLLADLQDAIAQRLSAEDYFAGPLPVPVLTEDIGDLENAIQQRVNQLGVCVLVLTPELQPGAEPNSGQVDVRLTVSEKVVVNRSASGTGKRASAVALAAVALLQDWRPRDLWTPLRMLRVAVKETKPLLVYEVTLRTWTILKTI